MSLKITRAHPSPRSFVGRFVALMPMDVERDVEELHAISHLPDEACALWRYMPCGPFAHATEQAAFLREWVARDDVVAFTVRAADTQSCLGSISLMSIRAAHGVAELGNIWYTPAAQRTTRGLHDVGAAALGRMQPGELLDFFDAFFALPSARWAGYLRIDAPPSAVGAAMREVFSSASWTLRRRMAASLPVPLLRPRP